MILHLINDSDVTRGGAQKIVNEMAQLPYSVVLDKNSRSGFCLSKVLGSYHWLIDLLFIILKYENPTVVIHSRCFFVLIPFLRIKKINCIFYCHAQYRRFKNVFRYVRFKRYICVSNTTKDYLESNGVDGEKIAIVPNPILPYENKSEDFSLETLQLHDFAYIGSLEKWKGILQLIDFLELYGKENKINLTLHVVGKGSLESLINDKIKELNFVELILYGYKEDPFAAIQRVPVVVVPSLEEGFGLVAIESIFNNKIVIFNDIPSLNEVCSNDSLSIKYSNENFSSFCNALKYSENKLYQLNNRDDFVSRRNEVLTNYGLDSFRKKLSSLLYV